MSVLVVGGAGYIGAHVVKLLEQRGESVVVVDNLSTGEKERVAGHPLIELDVASESATGKLEAVISQYDVSDVIHFASLKQVGESVAKPALYYQQNVTGLANLLLAMENRGVGRIIFSSSASVYGIPDVGVVSETVECKPINPYGQTKLVGEWLLEASERAWGASWVALRYFNVAGAGWDELGDPAVLNLVPMVFERLERGQAPRVFGEDYPTPDGTCIRDYIHVLDLAHAHLAAMDMLRKESSPRHRTYNVGTGTGASVKEVIEEIGRVSGLDVTPEIEPRRPGDPPKLIGDPALIEAQLGWKAQLGLTEIVQSAWSAWRHRHGSD